MNKWFWEGFSTFLNLWFFESCYTRLSHTDLQALLSLMSDLQI